MPRKVYIINKTAHDYSGAMEFGELVVLTEGSISRFSTNKIYRQIEDKIKNSKPDDYLLIGGHSVLCGIVCGLFAKLHGRLNLLVYRASRGNGGRYEERILQL